MLTAANKRRLGPYIDAIQGEGLAVADIAFRGSGHVAYTVEDGTARKTFIGPLSASDKRAVLNFRSYVRRWKAEKI